MMKILQPLFYALLICAGIIIGSLTKSTNSDTEKSDKLNAILQLINLHYVDTINSINFENNTINAILNKLDPHSSYIPEKKAKKIEEDMQGSFSGIGIQFNIINDSIVVVSPISGGPSEKLGIISGDRIITIEEEDVAGTGITNDGVVKRLRGKKGSVVNISIKRRGSDVIQFSITRDDIPLYSVDVGIMLQNDIGYIKINRFSATTYTEMMDNVMALKKEGMSKLILDLRGNPGGYLHIANQICDEFLKDGELIVFTKGRMRSKEEVFATGYGQLEDMPITVLIDEGSASASEIVSGALQDNDRGTIIGRRSFGKGLVQEQIEMQDGSLIRLTTQRYYTPSGRCIQKKYEKNQKSYYLEQYNRNQDNSKNDSLIYTTKNGRTVYGGGGITPDIIITRDSTLNFLQINRMIQKGWLNEYCLKKSELLQKQNTSTFQNININNIYESYSYFIKQKDADFDMQLGNSELNYLKNLMLATISRNIWGNKIYYSILCQEDEFIERAITEWKDH